MASFMKGFAVFFLVAGIAGTILVCSYLPMGDNTILAYAGGFLGALFSFGIIYSIGYALDLLERILASSESLRHGREYNNR